MVQWLGCLNCMGSPGLNLTWASSWNQLPLVVNSQMLISCQLGLLAVLCFAWKASLKDCVSGVPVHFHRKRSIYMSGNLVVLLELVILGFVA